MYRKLVLLIPCYYIQTAWMHAHTLELSLSPFMKAFYRL